MTAAVASFVKKPRALNLAMVPANDMAPSLERAARSVATPARLPAQPTRGDELAEAAREAPAILSRNDAAAMATRPLDTYRGVAVTVRGEEGDPSFTLSLLHEEAEHTLQLTESSDAGTIARAWQGWAKALDLPLLAVMPDGTVYAELSALGVVLAEQPSPRRKGSPLVGRRSRYGRRRRAEPLPHTLADAPRHQGREIIART